MFWQLLVWRHDSPPSCDEMGGRGGLCRNGGVSSRCSYLCCQISPARLKVQHCKKKKNRKKVYDRKFKEDSAMESPMKESPVRPGFHRLEVQKTTWDVPERYTALRPVGSGAYGTVWWVDPGRGHTAPGRLTRKGSQSLSFRGFLGRLVQ